MCVLVVLVLVLVCACVCDPPSKRGHGIGRRDSKENNKEIQETPEEHLGTTTTAMTYTTTTAFAPTSTHACLVPAAAPTSAKYENKAPLKELI